MTRHRPASKIAVAAGFSAATAVALAAVTGVALMGAAVTAEAQAQQAALSSTDVEASSQAPTAQAPAAVSAMPAVPGPADSANPGGSGTAGTGQAGTGHRSASPSIDAILGALPSNATALEELARLQQRLSTLSLQDSVAGKENELLRKMVERQELQRALTGAPAAEPPAGDALTGATGGQAPIQAEPVSTAPMATGAPEGQSSANAGAGKDASAVESGGRPAAATLPTVVALSGVDGVYNAVIAFSDGSRVRVREGQAIGTTGRISRIRADGVWLSIAGLEEPVKLDRGVMLVR